MQTLFVNGEIERPMLPINVFHREHDRIREGDSDL